MPRLIAAALAFYALTAQAADPVPSKPEPKPCPVGVGCPSPTLPKDRKYDSGKKQCGWTVVNGKKEPLFDCGGAK
jgi:hypothetical protein